MKGIMPQGTRQLLLPANPLFIWFSLFAALAVNMAQNFWLWGRLNGAPDFLLLVLVFWGIHQPQRIGMGVAFLFGLTMDVQHSGLLGQHALTYALASFIAISIHRRVLWFKTPTQAIQLFFLFLLAQLVELLLRASFEGFALDLTLLLTPCFEALCWPLVSFLLLSPQRRSPDPDATRPL